MNPIKYLCFICLLLFSIIGCETMKGPIPGEEGVRRGLMRNDVVRVVVSPDSSMMPATGDELQELFSPIVDGESVASVLPIPNRELVVVLVNEDGLTRLLDSDLVGRLDLHDSPIQGEQEVRTTLQNQNTVRVIMTPNARVRPLADGDMQAMFTPYLANSGLRQIFNSDKMVAQITVEQLNQLVASGLVDHFELETLDQPNTVNAGKSLMLLRQTPAEQPVPVRLSQFWIQGSKVVTRTWEGATAAL